MRIDDTVAVAFFFLYLDFRFAHIDAATRTVWY